MSVQAVAWAFNQDLSAIDKFVLVAVADMANETLACWPSQSFLAKRCGICRQRVNEALATLQTRGLLLVEHRARPDGGNAACRYRLPMSPTTTTHVAHHVASDDIPPINLSPTTTTHVAHDDTNLKEVSKKELKKDRSSIRIEFAVWYTAYPRHVARADAERAYAKARKEASAAELLAGIERYREGKPEYADWAHPASWLNKKRWQDEYGTAASASNGHDYPTEPPPPPFELHH